MDRVEKNDIVVVDILDMNQDGEGVGKVNGYPLFIKDTVIGDKAEVKVNRLKFKEIIFMMLLTAVITIIFYYVLAAFHTANLIPSTISVTTSFLAVYNV